MDQHKEKEAAENKSQDSTAADQQRKEAAAVPEESMDQRAGYKAKEESAPARGLLIKELLASGGEESLPALLAHPCSLLQLLFRVCAGCLGLHGYCSSDDPKAAASGSADSSSQEGEAGGDKANAAEALSQVRAAVMRRPTPPTPPAEGDGGKGGKHH